MTSFVDGLREELVAAAAREQAHPRPRLQLPPLRPMALATAGLALTAILVIAIAIAGGLSTNQAPDERPVKPPAPEGRPLFDGTLFPGERYRTRNFAPALSFVVTDDNWLATETESSDVLALSRVTRGGPGPFGPWPTLVFQRIGELYDPAVRDREAGRIPAPADLRAWLAQHPDLRVSNSEPVTVAGVAGARFSVEVRFTRPVHSDPFCRQRFRRTCTWLGPKLSLLNRSRMHVIQLRTAPEPLTVFLTAATSARRLAALERAAAPVLDSLRIDIP